MEDYEFDVFISYKRHERVIPWVQEVYDQIKYWLEQELGGVEPKIFFDKSTIETGTNWPDKLKNGVKRSKCMVGIWSPAYFQSKWCVAEWQSFHQRQLSLTNCTNNMILPMRFHDGEAFPADAQNIQSVDVRNYTSLSPAFWQTARAVELEDLIKELCNQIANAVSNAPAFDSSWPTLEPEPVAANRVELMRL